MEKELEKLIAENYEFVDYFFTELKDNFEFLVMEGEVLSKEKMEEIMDMSIEASDCTNEQMRVLNALKEKWMSHIESGSGVSDELDKVIRYIADLRNRYFGEKE